MAMPVILIDSATGSDTLASGAGPSTALTGSSASTSSDGLTVTLDGSPDLTDVATDGSHVIFLSDATAGNRNFGKITAKDDTAKTVTVSNAFGTSLSGLSWAIGGKRASLLGTTSAKLLEKNSAAGDAMPGWTIRMSSGHSETRASTITLRRGGDYTDGLIIVEGESGAATLPLLTFSNNGNAIACAAGLANIALRRFELQNTNATKTASVGIATSTSAVCIKEIKIANSTNKFWKGITSSASSLLDISSCCVENTANNGIQLDNLSGSGDFHIRNSRIASCGAAGISLGGSSGGPMYIEGNLIVNNTTDGILARNGAVSATGLSPMIRGNVIDGNGGDGIDATNSRVIQGLLVENNQITNNGGWGVNLNSNTLGALCQATVRNNNFGTGADTNTSGDIDVAGVGQDNLNVAPGYANTGSGDYSGGTAIKALGWPLTNVGSAPSGTRNYVDVGVQRQESSSSGGLKTHRGQSGGFTRT